MHKILLAEDDNDMRRFLVKALENAGFQVSPHDNGMSAYQRLRRRRPEFRFGSAQERQGAGQAGSPARTGQRSEQDAGGLIRSPFWSENTPEITSKHPCGGALEPIYGPHPIRSKAGAG